MEAQELCPLCGEGHVTAQVQQVKSEYKGHEAMLPLHFQLCDHCASDFAGAAEAKLNKRALMAFRKQVDGLLTGAEIAALREHYKLTQAQAARLFGGGPVAFSKYENDDVAQSEAMDTLLRLVRRSADAFWVLVDEKGMTDEFVKHKAVAHLQGLKVVASPTYRLEKRGSSSPYYEPRQFRRFKEEGDQACKT